MEKEIWKQIIYKGHKTDYKVSTHGNVKTPNGLILNTGDGLYPAVAIKANGDYYTVRVHRLVALMFIPNPKNKRCVNHIDFDRRNNYYKNLEWCTPKENINHSEKANRYPHPSGEKCHLWDKGRKIINKDTGVIYNSITQASRELGIPRTCINAELHGYRPHKYNIEFVNG